MSKLVVEVYVPAAQTAYDVRIPTDTPFSEVTQLVGQVISRTSGGLYEANGKTLLLDRESGTIFNINMTARELGLQTGSRLMLV